MTQRNLTKGSVARALFVVSAPMSLGILSVMMTGLADAFFLGRYGQSELAAVGFVYPVTITVTSLSIGLSAGVNSVLSRALGQDAGASQARLAFHCLLIAACLGLAVLALLSVTHSWILQLMGATGAALQAGLDYFAFWQLSFPFVVVTMASAAIMRAHGDGIRPAAIMAFEAGLNVALTPALIFGFAGIPELGATGAGLATMIARATAMTVAIGYQVRLGLVRRQEIQASGIIGSASRITRIALPAAGSNAINPAGLAIVTSIVAAFGDAAVAGFGAAGRIQSFALVPMLALSAGIGPVIGQNWGAGQTGRCHKAVSYALISCLCYGAFAGAVLALFASPLAQAMTAGAEAADYMARYLQIVGWSLFGYGFVVVINAAMNARDKAGLSLTLSLARIGVVYVPLAALLSGWLDFTGILAAAVAGNLGGAALGCALAARAGLLPGFNGLRRRALGS